MGKEIKAEEEIAQEATKAQAEEESALEEAFSDGPFGTDETAEDQKPSQDESQDLDQPGSDQEVETKEEPEATPVLIAGMTEDEIKSAVSKAKEVDALREDLKRVKDGLYGRLGGVEEKLKAKQQEKIDRLSPNLRVRLQEEFPELAAIFFDEAEDSDNHDEPADKKEVKEEDPPPEELSQDKKLEIRLLKSRHKDYAEEVQTEAFAKWFSEQSQEDQQAFSDSWDADYLGDQFDAFKKWKTEQETAPIEQETAAQKKKKRLEAALVEKNKGRGPDLNTDDEEAAMMAGFNGE